MATFTFTNDTGLTIIDEDDVSQTIEVYGLTGFITDVSVSLVGLTHTHSHDLDMLLLSPDRNLAFWTDIGSNVVDSGNDLTNLSVTISDSGATALPDDGGAPVSGVTYKPAGYGGIEGESDFDLTGTTISHPATNGAETFSVFDGFEASGTWTLIVSDDANGDFGTLQGWGLSIVTDATNVFVGGDTLDLTFTGADSGSYALDGRPSVGFSGVDGFFFSGSGDGIDTINLDHAPGGAQSYSFGANTVSGSFPTVNYGVTELVSLTTGSGADTFTFNSPTTAVIDISAGIGADRIVLNNQQNFTASTITGVETLQFGDVFFITTTFLGSQFGAGKINTVIGDSATDNLIVNAASDVNLSGVTFSNWSAGDSITINGTAAGEKLTGSSQIDTINGNGGADTLDGRGGTDIMKGGNGSDTYFAEVFNEIVTETNANLAAGGNDLVNFSGAAGTFVLSANVERLTLTHLSANTGGTGNASANTIKGNAGANTLSGFGGGDTLEGNAGNDTLDGGTGADTMRGGAQNETYVVDNAGDKAIESAGQGTDLVKASVSFTLGANVENLTLTGSGAVNGTGNSLANIITGNAGANRINGGAGIDGLIGGGGPDTFVFDAAIKPKKQAKANADLIDDFNSKDDTIELLASVFTKLKVGVLKKKAFDSGKKKPAKDKHLVYYEEKNGDLWYDQNGKKKGGKGDVLIATLDPGLDLTAADIVVA